MLQVGVEVHRAVAVLGIGIGRAALGQQVLHLLAGLQPVDQLLLQRHLRKVAAIGLDLRRQRIDLRGQHRRRDAARLAEVGEHPLPHVVHPEQAGFLRGRRRRIEHVRLRRRLERADLEQVHVHAELVLQALAVVLPVRGQAFQHHPALRHRVEVDLVRLRGQQVLALAEVVAERDHLLAGRLDRGDRRGDVAGGGEAARLEFVELQHHALDALVGAGRFQRAQQVAQAHLAAVLAIGGAGEGAAQRIAAELLHQPPLRRQHQRGALGQRRQLAAAQHRRQQQREHQQEQQVEDQPAAEVHRVPQADDDAGDGAAGARWIHCGLRMEPGAGDGRMLPGGREWLMRHRSR